MIIAFGVESHSCTLDSVDYIDSVGILYVYTSSKKQTLNNGAANMIYGYAWMNQASEQLLT